MSKRKPRALLRVGDLTLEVTVQTVLFVDDCVAGCAGRDDSSPRRREHDAYLARA